MKLFAMAAGVVTLSTGFLAGCASTPDSQMVECLQPNRRVVLEVVGTTTKPAPKPKEGQKPGKPEQVPAELSLNIQGNTAFDFNSAVLKKGGMQDIDDFLKTEINGKVPVKMSAIILAGHSDKFEGKDTALSENRAKSVMDYLTGKGLDKNMMFWEGRGSRDPVAVTKFCE
jgi:OmpA-OmpF porin, OOP family